MVTDVLLENGEILEKQKISKFVLEIINKFAEESLSVEEAKVVLQETLRNIEGNSRVEVKEI